MKVVRVTPFVTSFGASNWVFVKVETDEGILGWGEATLEGKELSVLGALEELTRSLVGADPTLIESLWVQWNRGAAWKGAVLYTAMSGLELALWDISGKALGVPVHRLLGGRVRDRVPAYTWPGALDSPEGHAELALAARDEFGYSAFKFDPFDCQFTVEEADLRRMEAYLNALRKTLGDTAAIAVDCHQRFLPAAAVTVAKRLEGLGIMFLEEPVSSDDLDGLARVRAASTVPLAAGERHFTRWGAWPTIKRGLVDVIQPDLCHVGGLLEARKLAAMAETAGILVAPHNPNGPVSTAAAVQLGAVVPNFLMTESVHTRAKLMREISGGQMVVKDGHIVVPDRPGLGIDLDETALLAHRGEPRDFPVTGPLLVTR